MTLGLSICTLLWRDNSPLIRDTALLLTANSFAKNLISSVLALPSTGGALMRIFNASPCKPTTSDFDAFGCKWQVRIKLSPCHRKNVLTAQKIIHGEHLRKQLWVLPREFLTF